MAGKFKNWIPHVNNVIAQDLDDIRNNFVLQSSINTVYIDQVNGNDNNDGSLSFPFKTLNPVFYQTPFGSITYCYIIGNYTVNQDFYLDGNRIVYLIGYNYDTTNNVPTNVLENDPNTNGVLCVKNKSVLLLRRLIINARSNTFTGSNWQCLLKIHEGGGEIEIGEWGYNCEINFYTKLLDCEMALGSLVIYNTTFNTTLTSSTPLFTLSNGGVLIYSEDTITDNTAGIITRTEGLNI